MRLALVEPAFGCLNTFSYPSPVAGVGFPLGSWIIRKAMVPSVEVAGKSLTGTRTRDRRRLPDQTGMGAMRDTRGRYGLPESGRGGRWHK
jgi:hypothetical protein